MIFMFFTDQILVDPNVLAYDWPKSKTIDYAIRDAGLVICRPDQGT